MKKLTFLSAFLFLGIIAKSQFTDLLDFNTTNGSNPYSSLTASVTGDTLYGVAAYGGAINAGSIFSIHRDGSNYTDMLDFDGVTSGAYPFGALTLSPDGKILYGTTSYGIYGSGNVFSIHIDGTSFSDIYEFSGYDGSTPYGAVSLSATADSLYILNSAGGNSGYGDIFCVSTNGSAYFDLFDFNGTNGAYGYGSLTFSKGYLFGLTSEGGVGYGTIFAFNPHTLGYADLYDFDGYSGYPYGDVIASITGDTLYGMTSEQGLSYGNVFAYILGGGRSAYQDLYEFSGTDGSLPEGDLTLARSGTGRDLLYGMTSEGGANGEGNIFSIKTNGSHYKDLFDFSNTNGIYPYSSLLYFDTILYGTCSQGGANSEGLVFSYNILSVDSFHVTNLTCTTGYLGSATVYPAGGVTPYTYYWTPGGNTTQTVTGLSAGTYTVVISDNVGSRAISIAVMRGLSVDISEVINVSCHGGTNGSAQATPSGGTAPYGYSWSRTTALATAFAPVEGPWDRSLSAGIYTVTVTDSCGNTATAAATVSQPDSLMVSAAKAFICPGSSIILSGTSSGGTAPYTYSSFPAQFGCDSCLTVTPTSSSEYNLMVTDNNGCTATTFDTVIVRALPTAPEIDALGRDSVRFVISKPDSTLSYSWSATDMYGHTYSGTAINDTIYLLYYLRGATLTVSATDIHGCTASTVIPIIHPIISNYNPPANLPYPRWSKRGMYLDSADVYMAASPAIQNSIVQYVKRNQITYVLLQSLEDYVFGGMTHYIDTTNARLLANFIALLKDSAGVEEVGVECYDDAQDSTAWNGGYYDIYFVGNSIRNFNWNFTTDSKIDVVSMDDEFMYDGTPSQCLHFFHTLHMPILRELYQASRECPANFLKVEDYLEEPTDPSNSSFDVWDPVEVMEKDSIAMYADRIQNSCYSAYPNALYNEADFIMTYPVFGSDSIVGIDGIHKTIELWPAFDPADSTLRTTCIKCWDTISPANYLGDSLCHENKTPDYMEERYYDSLRFSEKYHEFTSSISNPTPMGDDTNFTIGGSFWFQYHCLQHVQDFDTGAASALKFYVYLGPNIQWYYPSRLIPPAPITLRARTHGGTPPFNYIWYNDSDKSVLQSSSSDTLVVHFLFPKKISVLAIDADTLTATDYINIYQMCDEAPVEKPIKRNSVNTEIDSNSVMAPIRIYPNPNNGRFTIEYQLHGGETGNLILFNELGGKMGEYQLEANTNKMNITNNNLSNGVYIYQLWVNNKVTQRGKLVIIK